MPYPDCTMAGGGGGGDVPYGLEPSLLPIFCSRAKDGLQVPLLCPG